MLDVVGINGTNLCSLTSLQTLTLGSSLILDDECVAHLPLYHVEFLSAFYEVFIPFRYLRNLTSLTVITSVGELDDAVLHDLCSLNSKLVNFSLWFDVMTLNSTTFQCFANWNTTLSVLDITSNEFWIEESPFHWFVALQILRLTGGRFNPQPIKIFSANAFDGLENLRELHMNYLYFNVLASGALDIFNIYNSLQVLDFAHNTLPDISCDRLSQIRSLQTIDLTDNGLPDWCYATNPDLRSLLLNSASQAETSFNLAKVCHQASKLTILDVTLCVIPLQSKSSCLQLESLSLAQSSLAYSLNDDISVDVPALKMLHLIAVQINDNFGTHYIQNLQEVSNIFITKNLQILDVSANEISVITRKDSGCLRNLTTLDLSNNNLISLREFPQINEIQILILTRNKLANVPQSFLSTSHHPKLTTLTLNSNPLVCDCKIEALRKWLLTDARVKLTLDDYYSPADINYVCSSPDSIRGVSVTELN